MITRQQKHAVAKREAKMRRKVYPRFVVDGRMSQSDADFKLRAMEAIAEDYAEPDLFSQEGKA
jgi:hypothetical protein